MAALAEPEPALLIVAVLHADADLLGRAVERLAGWLGPLRAVGREWDFVWSDYYAAELGPGLRRGFVVGERLAPRDSLADLKLLCGRIEIALARPDGRRRLNLDPGLLGLDNLVLASTKRQPQRVYLRDGIWAEVTLQYAGGAYEPLARTYPDYREPSIRGLLGELRAGYRQALREARGQIDPAALRSALAAAEEVRA